MQKSIYILLATYLGCLLPLAAQDDPNIGTETVTVVKPYSPAVSDAFKIKSAPDFGDSITLRKKEISYTIFSVPVASTFAPAKGKASPVKKAAPETIFNSYASVGLGNFNNALVDFYTSRDIYRGNERLDIGLNHRSSRGDIDNTPLDTDFYNTRLQAAYSNRDSDRTWGVDIGLQHQLYNWYGLPEGVFDQATIDAMDERQQFYAAEAGGYIDMEDSFFKRGEIRYRRFWDALDSGENRVIFAPSFQIPLNEEFLIIKASLDYVGGNFSNADVTNIQNAPEISYGLLQAAVNPGIVFKQDALSLSLGANIVYGLDTELSDSNFYIYPDVSASFELLEEAAIAYAGVTGNLEQNSYYDFVKGNPYVSPTLQVQPTDRQYDAYLGLKGQLLSNLSYNIKGSYTAENRKPLFLLNPQNTFRNDEKSYYYGNSFRLFYDDVKTIGIFGELELSVNRNFSLGVNATVNDYNTETDNPAWNLPSLQGSLFLDYQIGDKWFLGSQLFYIGERDDLITVAVQNVSPDLYPATPVTLDSYFDANVHVGYHITDQLSVFAKGSNLANNQYQRWANFRVQSLQVLAGLTYKFDL
jgi:hypothetical protein